MVSYDACNLFIKYSFEVSKARDNTMWNNVK